MPKMGQVGSIEISALAQRRVQVGIENMGVRRVVISRPFMEMIRNIERGWVRGCVFEIHDDYLRE